MSTTYSAVVRQRTVIPVEIQVRISRRGLPRWRFSGQALPEVREGRDRILQALQQNRMFLPRAAVSVGFSPAAGKKSGTGLDIALLLAVLQEHALIPLGAYAAVGELDFTGRLHSVRQEYALVHSLLELHTTVFLPKEKFDLWRDYPKRSRLVFCEDLAELLACVQGRRSPMRYRPEEKAEDEKVPTWPLSPSLVRVLSLSLIGRHPLLLFGAPGVGKSYAARLVHALLPPETRGARICRKVQASLLGRESENRVFTIPATVTKTELFGGRNGQGLIQSATEVLFLDELPEYRRECREMLRQHLEITPLSSGNELARCVHSPVIMATANPCPCGYDGTPKCTCRPDEKQRYRQKISQPLLDRFSLVWRVSEKDHAVCSREDWEKYAARLNHAMRLQSERTKQGFPEYAHSYQWEHLQRLFPDFGLHPDKESFRRLLIPYQLAQTLADWNGETTLSKEYLWEAEHLCQRY